MENSPTALRLVSPLLALLLSPLLAGVVLRVKAIFAGRRGQPLMQVYFDVVKCLRKGAVYSQSSSWISRMAPAAIFSVVAGAVMLLPCTAWGAPISFSGDIFLFISLLALARFLTLVLALDCGSSFTGMGASREAFFSTLAEPVLFLGLAALAHTNHQISFAGLYGGSPFGIVVSLLAGVSLFIVLLSENCRVPMDDPATHLELTMIHEVMVLDQSGPEFGWISYGAAVKLWLFAALVAQTLLPLNALSPLAKSGALLASIFGVAIVVGIVESTMARLRLQRVPQLLVGAGALAFLALFFGKGM